MFTGCPVWAGGRCSRHPHRPGSAARRPGFGTGLNRRSAHPRPCVTVGFGSVGAHMSSAWAAAAGAMCGATAWSGALESSGGSSRPVGGDDERLVANGPQQPSAGPDDR
jgi:hypothetical protein